MSPPRVFRAATAGARKGRPGLTSVKIAGGFVAAIAFSGVVAASWIASWSAIEPSVARLARPAPQHTSERKVPCDRQTWPYIAQDCMEIGDKTAANPTQEAIRVISPDKRAPKPDAERARTATELASTRLDAQDARQAARWSVEAGESAASAKQLGGIGGQDEASTVSASVPLPPPNPHRRDTALSPTDTATTRLTATKQDGPEDTTASAGGTATDNISSSAVQREEDTATQRARRRNEQSVSPGRDRRFVTVHRTYVLPDGRRVTVRQTYRTVPAPYHYRSEQPRYYRPYAEYGRSAPHR